MRTVLHIIFRKSVVKLCFIVLLVVFFVNESFSQAYNPQYYQDSYSRKIYEVPGLFNLNRYEIHTMLNYYGGGSLFKPYITDHLYVNTSLMFNITYSVSAQKTVVNIKEEGFYISTKH